MSLRRNGGGVEAVKLGAPKAADPTSPENQQAARKAVELLNTNSNTLGAHGQLKLVAVKDVSTQASASRTVGTPRQGVGVCVVPGLFSNACFCLALWCTLTLCVFAA